MMSDVTIRPYDLGARVLYVATFEGFHAHARTAVLAERKVRALAAACWESDRVLGLR